MRGDQPLMLMSYGQKRGVKYVSIDMYALQAKEDMKLKRILGLLGFYL